MSVTRFIHGAEEGAQQQQPQAPVESSRVHTGALSFQAGSDSGTVQRSNASHTVTQDGMVGGSVMDTLRKDSHGQSVELIPGQPASRTLLSQAVKLGLVEEFAPGRFRDVGQEAQRQVEQQLTNQEEPQEAQEDPGLGSFDKQEDEQWAAAIDPIPQWAYDSAMASGVAVIAHGQGTFEDASKALAQASGMDPAEAAEYFHAGYAMYRGAVARGLAYMGLTGDRLEAFFDSTRESPQKLQDAMQRVYQGRDVGGFKEMAAEWVAKNPSPEVQALKAAGFETFIDRKTGEAMARREGGSWVPVKALLGSGS